MILIPARGGSKGVPGKNIRLLGGIPLIAHTIRQALAVIPNEEVVVSTDSEDIARVAREFGASVPFMRPAELATDTASSRDVMIHALDFFRERGKNFGFITLLQPTSPFRDPDNIRKAINLFKAEKPEMVVSVREARTNPYYTAYECTEEGFLHISKGEGNFTRRQDAPEVWEFDGSIYVIDAESLRRYPTLGKMKKILPLPIRKGHHVDIDSELDFLIAEHLINSSDN